MANDSTSSRITVPQLVLPLPGKLDDTPVFTSNSPETVLQQGILLSTFPPDGKSSPTAHLNCPLSGRFDLFFHHITDSAKAVSRSTLYLGLLIGNLSDTEVIVRVLNAVSYLTIPDAPFRVLESVIDNADAKAYAGPGDRVMLDSLRAFKQTGWDDSITLSAHETKVLFSLPMPLTSLFHHLNGRTGFVSLHCDGPVHMALLAAFADRGILSERKPELKNWLDILKTASLVQPRDKKPTPPDAPGELVYGRTAGVAIGSIWRGSITNDDQQSRFTVKHSQVVSYPISTVSGGTLGTDQVQSAPLMVRYSDTSHVAHGNYSVLYDLNLPIYNGTESEILVGISFQSPLKQWSETTGLRFLRQPPNAVVFRGSIKFQWKDKDQDRIRLIHLVQNRGQMQDALVELALSPDQQIDVNVSFRYPPDCTPPHVLTISAKTDHKGSDSH